MIHVVLGTKAQLIKMAPVMQAIRARGLNYNFVSTGQHMETMDALLQNFGLPYPDLTLYNGPDITSIPAMVKWAGRILWRTAHENEAVFKGDRRGIVLVHGDTFSTLLGALMGKLAGMDVGHVESGLRSFKLLQPFPEEITRLLVFRMANVMFCPGEWACENVRRYRAQIVNTEMNTLVDSLRYALTSNASITELPETPYAIVSVHRFENIFSRARLRHLVSIIESIAQRIHVLFILHIPTEKKLREGSLLPVLERNSNIDLRPRQDYFNFVRLLDGADLVISDGGSNQEECAYLGKPTLLLRSATERQEGLGANCVVSNYDEKRILEFVCNYRDYSCTPCVPGDVPSDKIAQVCERYAGQ